MTSSNDSSRLDRIEAILSQNTAWFAQMQQILAEIGAKNAETAAIANSNARAVVANSNTIAENDARTSARFAEVAQEIDALREVVLNFVDGIQVTNQRSEDRFTEIVGQVRDLQVQNSRILDRLEGLEGQSGQG
jgi:hypothetical protein